MCVIHYWLKNKTILFYQERMFDDSIFIKENCELKIKL